jgi:hypothetical protein
MSFVVVGCTNGSDVVLVESNALGIARVQIEHVEQNGDQVLTVRGLDDSDHEVALATLRTGTVMYTFDPDLHPAAPNAGTELVAAVGDDTLDSVTPDRDRHEMTLPESNVATFLHLHAVATAIYDEAGISFAPARTTDETAYSASTCDGSFFPSSVGNPFECCQDGASAWFTINNGSRNGQLAWRTYGTACTTSDGGGYCADPNSGYPTCNYGPCGAMNNQFSQPDASDAAVFYPVSNASLCGADSDPGNGDGYLGEANEYYTGGQTLYPGVTSSCPYTDCCYDPLRNEAFANEGACPSIAVCEYPVQSDGRECDPNPQYFDCECTSGTAYCAPGEYTDPGTGMCYTGDTCECE